MADESSNSAVVQEQQKKALEDAEEEKIKRILELVECEPSDHYYDYAREYASDYIDEGLPESNIVEKIEINIDRWRDEEETAVIDIADAIRKAVRRIRRARNKIKAMKSQLGALGPAIFNSAVTYQEWDHLKEKIKVKKAFIKKNLELIKLATEALQDAHNRL